MTEFIGNHDYQEIKVEEINHIYKVVNDYNSFYKLPRQGRGNIGDEYTYLQAFYRGQCDSSWKIMPSICRNEGVDERVPERGDLLFEEMAYKQHYSQATRLIDFTTDINIALYFACCDSMDKDGAVFIWSCSPYDSKWVRTKIQCELVNTQKDKLSIREFAEEIFGKYPELKDKYSYTDDFHADLVSFLYHGFMIMQPRRQQKDNIRIQRQKGCLYVCGVKFETPIGKMRTSSKAGQNIFCPREVVVPRELDGGYSLVKIIIPAKLKYAILNELKSKGITKEYLLPDQI